MAEEVDGAEHLYSEPGSHAIGNHSKSTGSGEHCDIDLKQTVDKRSILLGVSPAQDT
jgi:hypothetical protein